MVKCIKNEKKNGQNRKRQCCCRKRCYEARLIFLSSYFSSIFLCLLLFFFTQLFLTTLCPLFVLSLFFQWMRMAIACIPLIPPSTPSFCLFLSLPHSFFTIFTLFFPLSSLIFTHFFVIHFYPVEMKPRMVAVVVASYNDNNVYEI